MAENIDNKGNQQKKAVQVSKEAQPTQQIQQLQQPSYPQQFPPVQAGQQLPQPPYQQPPYQQPPYQQAPYQQPPYQQPPYQQPYPQQVVVVQSPKSMGLALLLTFLFGPLGQLYANVTHALIMIVVAIVLGIFTFGLGALPCWLISMVWAYMDVKEYNDAIMRGQMQRPF